MLCACHVRVAMCVLAVCACVYVHVYVYVCVGDANLSAHTWHSIYMYDMMLCMTVCGE